MTDTTAAEPKVTQPTVHPPAAEPDSPNDRRVFWLAVAVIAMVFIIILLLFFVTIPKDNKDTLETVVGVVVSGGLSGILGFYFGSSQISKAKDSTIANLSAQ